MEIIRKPFQGVWNIIRFNWHYYLSASFILLILVVVAGLVNNTIGSGMIVIAVLIFAILLISLGASLYIYDLSGLYYFDWMENVIEEAQTSVVNINAGFDETSKWLRHKYSNAKLDVFDFYDPALHTEISIKRARAAYPPYPGTISIKTGKLPVRNNASDSIFIILAAHEIRIREERIVFFKECRRLLRPGGQIVEMEHLRDLPNFLVYTIGFFHFHSKAAWLDTFENAGLTVRKEIKHTPFISIFILSKDDPSN